MENATLKILPLGGLGEIGLNMMAVVFENDAIIIDAGLMFPDESMPGVDIVIPDLDVILRQGWNILGIILTHGHEDHIGALPYVLKKISVPVYATDLTTGFIENKLDEFDLLGSTQRNIASVDDPILLGPFRIDLFAMCHSVADGVGVAVTTPAGLIMHSGDFKLDPTPVDGRLCDLEKISSLSRNGVLALFSDSTQRIKSGHNVVREYDSPGLRKNFHGIEGACPDCEFFFQHSSHTASNGSFGRVFSESCSR